MAKKSIIYDSGCRMATPIHIEMSFGTGHSQSVPREFSLLILFI